MKDRKSKKAIVSLIIGALLIFHIINNVIILNKYPCIFSLEEGAIKNQIEKTEVHNEIIQTLNTTTKLFDRFLKLATILKTPSQRPKLAHFILGVSELIFGEKNSTRIINTLYYLLIILGTYLVGAKFYNAKVGLFSACLVSLYTGIFEFSRTHNLDFPLTAFFIFTFYLLVYSNNFSKTFHSILFGIFLGIGILIKGSILIFLITPILFYFYYIFKNFNISLEKLYKPIVNLIGSLLIAILISSFWWNGNIGAIISKFLLYLNPNKITVLISSPFLLTNQPNGLFPKAIYNISMVFKEIIIITSDFLFFIFLFGFFLFLRKKQLNRILIFSFFVPLIILSFSALKLGRYFMPILPLMAIVTSAGLLKITNKNKKIVIVILICVIVFIQFFEKTYKNPKYKFNGFYARIYADYMNISEKFINFIATQNKNNSSIVFISETSSKNHSLFSLLRYFMIKNGFKDINVVGIENLDKSDFVVLLLDRKYFFKIASLFETCKTSSNIELCFSVYDKYPRTEYDQNFTETLINSKNFDNYIKNITQLIYGGNIKILLEIYDKLLILEGIKRNMLDIKEVKQHCKRFFSDISLWSEIYSKKGIDGLIQDLTLSHEEFISLLQGEDIDKPLLRDDRWNWLYKNIIHSQLIMVEHGEIPSLEVDFYLFSKKKN